MLAHPKAEQLTTNFVGQWLGLRDKDQLARSLTTKLLTYSTGGAPTKPDHPEIEAIVARVRNKNYGFRSLLHEVVQSELFQNK